ncbi:MAG: tRNA 2-thiouridine(34) synthase MnmA [Bacteroidales bacterium]|nr:tRNA 2-thiouridine(34) synthase MnmA [Bacteroidales bacterium]
MDNQKDNSKIKVCVGLSGGVDSSVAALLLKQQGYDVFAMFMQNWSDAETTLHGDCEWEEDRFVAEMVARKIGIPFYFINLSKTYRKRVVDYMFDEYAKGRTPNPDVLCNREIKFDAFLEAAERLGADYVATGHYCRKEIACGTDGKPLQTPEGQPVYRLLEGTDPGKDQSYFLCQLSQEQLAKALFPIGHLLKKEVREIARQAELMSADKKDSQGICFIGKVDLPTFLKQQLEPREGQLIEVFDAYYSQNEQYRFMEETMNSLTEDGKARMITSYISEDKELPAAEGSRLVPEKLAALSDSQLRRLSSPVDYNLTFQTETYRSGKHHVKKTRYKENPFGRIIGTHEGCQFYTIGQRKGLGVGGHKEPVFIIETDPVNNIVYVGEGHTHKGLSRSCLRIAPEEIHALRPKLLPPVGGLGRFDIRIRYRQPLQKGWVLMRESGAYVIFDAPQRGITPGQFAALYKEGEIIASGPISDERQNKKDITE